MIFDTWENLAQYKGISKALDTAIDDLRTRDLAGQADGRVELADGVFFTVSDVVMKCREEGKWECHDAYIDLQYCISGEGETIDYIPRNEAAEWRKEPTGDISFSEDPAVGTPLPLQEGCFAVFFPQDAHKPCLGEAGVKGRKLIYKIPV